MARFDDDGARVAATLFEAAAFQYAVGATCRCGRRAVFDPHALWWRFRRRGWDERLRSVGARLVCHACGSRDPAVALVSEPATVRSLPLPPGREWRRAANRFRN